MMKRTLGAAVAVVLFFCSAFFSCSEVDDTLGEGLIPNDQQMNLRVDTIHGVRAYLAESDSLPTGHVLYGYFGSIKDPKFGTTKASMAFQYLWATGFIEEDFYNFGFRPTVDSLVVNLALSSFGGDTSVVRTFNIYELQERIYLDSAYYGSHDMSQAVNFNEPISTFTHGGGKDISVSLTGPQAEDLMRRLVDTTGGRYRDDSIFLNTYKGFYIVQTDDSPEAASITTVDYSNSSMTLYVRNFEPTAPSQVNDTLNIVYTFRNVAADELSPITGFNVFTHDYTGTNIQNINDTLETSTPVNIGYIKALGGVVTYLRFSSDFISELRSKIVPPYTKMVVNRAELRFPINEPSLDVLNKAHKRLGAYYSYAPYFTGIIDYSYLLEDENYYYDPIELPYDGYLDRSNYHYTLNIASYVQQMTSGAKKPFTFMLGPSYTELYDFYQAEIITGGNNPEDQPQVILTYTLIK